MIRRLLDRECAARGLDPAAAPPLTPDAALLGTAAADVLTLSPAARAVFAAVTAAVAVSEDEVRAAYERDRPTRPDRWTIRQAFSRDVPPAAVPDTTTDVDPMTLLPAVRTAAGRDPALIRTELGWHLVVREAVIPAGPVPYAAGPRASSPRPSPTAPARPRSPAGSTPPSPAVPASRRATSTLADPTNPDATHRH